jgi:hypothetical protein
VLDHPRHRGADDRQEGEGAAMTAQARATRRSPDPFGPFCYSPRQRAEIIRALPSNVEVDHKDLVAKLEVAAGIALDPSRFVWPDLEVLEHIERLKDAVALAPSRKVLAEAGLNLGDLGARLDETIDRLSRPATWNRVGLWDTKTKMEVLEDDPKKWKKGPIIPVLVLTKLNERRRLFVRNVVVGVWSTTMPAPKYWPLGRVKGGAPLVRLADAALPEQLQLWDFHREKYVSLRRAINDALREMGWADIKRAHEQPTPWCT